MKHENYLWPRWSTYVKRQGVLHFIISTKTSPFLVVFAQPSSLKISAAIFAWVITAVHCRHPESWSPSWMFLYLTVPEVVWYCVCSGTRTASGVVPVGADLVFTANFLCKLPNILTLL